jgi:hypothetical protein
VLSFLNVFKFRSDQNCHPKTDFLTPIDPLRTGLIATLLLKHSAKYLKFSLSVLYGLAVGNPVSLPHELIRELSSDCFYSVKS